MHGAYYGALMSRHDPLRLRSPLDPGATKRENWQAGGAYFYFYTYYCRPTQMSVPLVGGVEISRAWDKTPDLAA